MTTYFILFSINVNNEEEMNMKIIKETEDEDVKASSMEEFCKKANLLPMKRQLVNLEYLLLLQRSRI